MTLLKLGNLMEFRIPFGKSASQQRCALFCICRFAFQCTFFNCIIKIYDPPDVALLLQLIILPAVITYSYFVSCNYAMIVVDVLYLVAECWGIVETIQFPPSRNKNDKWQICCCWNTTGIAYVFLQSSTHFAFKTHPNKILLDYW